MTITKTLTLCVILSLSSSYVNAFTLNPHRLRSLSIANDASIAISKPKRRVIAPTSRNPSNPTITTTLPMSSSPSLSENDTTITTPPTTPLSHYDAIICGGGPAGLLTAIMLSQKHGPTHRIAVCERRPSLPPHPTRDPTIWNDAARFYLLGIGHRGQDALRAFGVYDDFVAASVPVNGRRDWSPGMTKVEDGRITPAKKDVVSRVLARDRLVGVLYHHILENYDAAAIDLLYGYDVEPLDFGSEGEDVVTVRLSRCEDPSSSSSATTVVASHDADPLCDVDDAVVATTDCLVGADGSARTVANAMERQDAARVAALSPLRRPFSKPFEVTRYHDDNPRVFKSVPVKLPSSWPCDLNYSARSRENRITLEALPSDAAGNLCALLLMTPDDELAREGVDPAALRAFFDEEFPQFGALVDEAAMARVAAKPATALPSFRYAGPRLNMGRRTVILGDAAHTVKPYYGLGANTALEDVKVLSEVMDEVTAAAATEGGGERTSSGVDAAAIVPGTVKLFSDRRAADSKALVVMSRNMDRPGKLFFVCFLLPIILDGIFHKMAPRVFGPNIFGMFQKKGMGFKQIQTKKRWDRSLQVLCLGVLFTVVGMGVKAFVTQLARITGKSHGAVTASAAAVVFMGMVLRQSIMGKPKAA